MKYIGLIAGLGLAVFAGMQAQTVKAADDDVVGSKTTNFDIDLTGGTIELTDAPASLSFNNPSISDLAQADQKLQSQTGEIGNITIEDYRGTGSGWTLSAELSPLGTTPRLLKTTGLEISGSRINSYDVVSGPDIDNLTPPYFSKTLATSTPENFWMTNNNQTGMGKNQLHLESASLTLPAQNGVLAGNYSGTITWTLTGSSDQSANMNN